MPFFTARLNAMANALVNDAGVFYLHTAAPTDADPTNGRTSTGGGLFETGIVTAATDWTDASNGDVENSSAFDFGTATADVGTVTHWSYEEGGEPCSWGTLPTTTPVNDGDSYSVNPNSVQLNGSSS